MACGACLEHRPGERSEAFWSHRAQARDGHNGHAEIETPADLPVSIIYSRIKDKKIKSRVKRKKELSEIQGRKQKASYLSALTSVTEVLLQLTPVLTQAIITQCAQMVCVYQLCVHWMTLSHASFLI